MTKIIPDSCGRCGGTLSIVVYEPTPQLPVERRGVVCTNCEAKHIAEFKARNSRKNKFLDERDI